MKPIFLAVLASTIAFTPQAHALFGHVAAEKERRTEVEQRLIEQQQRHSDTEQRLAEQQQITVQQQQRTDRWQNIAYVAGIGCVVMLIAGTAIGSKGRNDVVQ